MLENDHDKRSFAKGVTTAQLERLYVKTSEWGNEVYGGNDGLTIFGDPYSMYGMNDTWTDQSKE